MAANLDQVLSKLGKVEGVVNEARLEARSAKEASTRAEGQTDKIWKYLQEHVVTEVVCATKHAEVTRRLGVLSSNPGTQGSEKTVSVPGNPDNSKKSMKLYWWALGIMGSLQLITLGLLAKMVFSR